MTSMESLLLDESPLNRNGFSSSVNCGYAKPPQNCFNIYDRHFPISPLNQHLILNRGAHKPSGSHPPPAPAQFYSSLPSYLSARPAISPPLPLLLQPPLLPLPSRSFPKSAPLPSGGKKINDTIAERSTRSTVRVRDHRKKRRPIGGFKKDPHLLTSPIAVSVPQTNKKEEIVKKGFVISPPPSSLPLPSFALVRLRSAKGPGLSATFAMGCGRGGEDDEMRGGGAADDIRRLLRI